ncbi:MAG TPA: flagellar motor protein MotB [Polyangia bacterium]|nr:flagellar motor protein MotB [Polyangia bacterium]
MAAAEDKPKLRIIVKKKGGHGHHGGAWKVAYADFVTAMMALFMVLWLLSVADPKTKKDIARYFRDPGFLQGGSAMIVPGDDGGQSGKPAVMQSAPSPEAQAKRAAEAEEATLQKEAKALKAELDRAASESSEMADLRKQVIVTVAPEGLQIQLVDKDGDHDLLFNLASAELKPALVALLKHIAGTLAKIDNPLVIGGHTDARAYVHGAGKTNWDLSYERASAARKVLEVGPLVGRVHRVTAYGSSEPFNVADPNAAENRRLTLVALRKFKVVPPSEQAIADKAAADDKLSAGKAAAVPMPGAGKVDGAGDKGAAGASEKDKGAAGASEKDKGAAGASEKDKGAAGVSEKDKGGEKTAAAAPPLQITAEKVAAAQAAAERVASAKGDAKVADKGAEK